MSIEAIKNMLGFSPEVDNETVIAEWDKRTKSVCKPCWELKYCPYGPLVEEFPLPPVTRKYALAHQEYLKICLLTGKFGPSEELLDDERRKFFQESVDSFRLDEHPEEISSFEQSSSCTEFGHLCPVFFVNEPFTETSEMRRIGRYISFGTKMRVARRDNYTCQKCGKHLRDDDLEFDHVIPVSRGGSSEEHNIRLTCFDCNRGKSDKVEL